MEQTYVVSTLALQLCISNDIIHSYELSLWQKPFWAVLCHAPEKSSRSYWKLTTWQEGHKAWILFLALQYDITCHSAYRCISLNCCFYLKPLHLAPNFCWQYTMGYLYSCCFLCKHKIITHKQLKNPIGTKWFFFFFYIFNEPSSFFVYIHNNTQTHKANKTGSLK